jgi:NAD-dependent dihydropyrimidine dehydrogenase PreA subunit
MKNLYIENTLRYDPDLCNGCRLCTIVCPHDVFEQNGKKASLVHPENCMECGACQLNCQTGAIVVDSGVGCASAMMRASISGQKEPCCGPSDEPSCCDDDKPISCC